MIAWKTSIIALFAAVVILEVGCEQSEPELNIRNNFQPDGSFVPIPVKLRLRRDVAGDLNTDDCHKFHNDDLPEAKEHIASAWSKSVVAVSNVTQAITDLKQCVSWNIFTTIPCVIHSAVELFQSYRTYKPELAQFLSDVRLSAENATTSFFGCAKILIAHKS